MFNFFLLKFLFSQILCCVPSLSCGCPALGPGRLRVLHWHPSLQFWSAPPFPLTHYLAMDWALLGMHHLIAICQPGLPSAEDIWRGILSPWGVTKQTRLWERTLLNRNENCTAPERAQEARPQEIARARTEVFLPTDPSNVCWGWWLILLLKTVSFHH